MIDSKKKLKYYLEADRIALEIERKKPKAIGNEIWKLQRLLRKLEYYKNTKKSFFSRIFFYYYSTRFFLKSIKLGIAVYPNTFGPGLNIAHIGSIVVSPYSKIGKNCRIHACVNIGVKAGTTDKAPVIGDNVYIGPGVKIYGNIKIADEIAIGANSVVNKTFNKKGITIAGIPAKKINNKGSYGLLVKAAKKIPS